MFDLFIPSYVWKFTITLLFIKEIRHWTELILSIEDENDEMPESVKHMFS